MNILIMLLCILAEFVLLFDRDAEFALELTADNFLCFFLQRPAALTTVTVLDKVNLAFSPLKIMFDLSHC